MDISRIEIVDDMMAEVLRNKTPAERIGIGFGLWTSVRKLFDLLTKTAPLDRS